MTDIAHQSADSANPLMQLPADWRGPIGLLYAFYSDTLRGSLGLAVRFRLWIETDGLTLEEAETAIRRMMKPTKAAEIEHVGKLMADLACEVAEAMRPRKNEAARKVLMADLYTPAAPWVPLSQRQGGRADG